MSAKELIELANKKGVGVSRYRSGHYQYAKVVNEKHVVTDFHGSWHQFVAFIKAI
jgi:predicted RNA binding protein YcfA (HicA-like mRNA interferase family)